MMKEVDQREIDNYSLKVALEALVKSIARLTEHAELHTTAIPGLSLFRHVNTIACSVHHRCVTSQTYGNGRPVRGSRALPGFVMKIPAATTSHPPS